MLKKTILSIAGVAALFASQIATAGWDRLDSGDVEVSIIGEHGRSLPEYPVKRTQRTYRAYLEARQGTEYGVRIRNRSNQRIGVVVAVDGRNIISGKHSKLRSNERMYILQPYQTAVYDGWRTGKNRINRFYFTDSQDSYSGRWGDYSAMGVIAVAAFAERRPQYQQEYSYRDNHESRRSNPGTGTRSNNSTFKQKSAPAAAEPGTGYGDGKYSPSRRVKFKAKNKAFARYFVKYEWRKTLCELGVINCRNDYQSRRPNRMWDDSDFAPPPPGGYRAQQLD